MNSKIIGDKKVFAIEYTVETIQAETVYGGCRVWLSGQFLGDIQDPIYLTGFLIDLKGLAYNRNKLELNDEIPFFPDNSTNFVKMLEKSSDIDDRHWVFMSEGFDSFYKLCFKNRKTLVFYWCLIPNIEEYPISFERFKNYPKEVLKAEVPISVIKKVTDEFEIRMNEIIQRNQTI